jgi:hypothetical protein
MSEYSSKYIICPYCGHKRYPDIGGFDFEDESCEEDECEECEEVFILKPYSSWSWTTEKLAQKGGENNG